MQNHYFTRPQTSKYRNQSHVHFGDSNAQKQPDSQCSCARGKKRPQSYRNLSKMAEFMKDTEVPMKEMSKVYYTNIIQNRDQSYDVPRIATTPKNEHSQQFQAFFEKTQQRMYKPIDEFTEYTDLMKKNSQLLRRGQFNTPLESEQFSRYKRDQNNTNFSYKTSKYYTKFRGTTTDLKMGNTIAASMCESIKQKRNIKKEKLLFAHKTQKYIKPLNKTFMGYAHQYDSLVNKQRQNNEKISLKNAMNRVLTMQIMGDKISGLTRLYI